MICLNMSLFIVAAFLLLTLIVGGYFSRKKTTFREYAVGHKQFATATLVATVLATFFQGGGLVRNIECVYDLGLWFTVILLLVPLGMWSTSRFALRMGPFMQHLSLAETIGSIYGTYAKVITVLVSICCNILLITSQIVIVSQTIGICVTLDNPYVIPVLSTSILIFYSTFGGGRAVTLTDVFQFITFSIVIPLLCWFAFAKIGKPVATIVPILQSHTKFQFTHLFHSNNQLIHIVLLLLADIPSSIVASPLTQRVYMAASPIQAQKVFSYAAIFSFIIQVFIVLIGLFIFVGASNLPKVEIWPYIMGHIPPLFKGFVASILAMVMSTADSCLNTCAVMVSHDIAKSLIKQKKISDSTQLKIARWTTLTVGLLSMVITFKYNDLLKLMYWGLNCRVPILTAPFILAVFGFRGTPRTALVGMTTGACTILAWNKWIKPAIEIDGSFMAMVANGLAMLAAHYLLKQPKSAGWVKPDHEFKQVQQAHARNRAERREMIKNGWANRKSTLSKLIPSDAALRLTGLYVVITAILGYWFIRPDHIYWAICQGLVGALLTSSKTFFSSAIPAWCIGLGWLIGLVVYLPLSLLGHWWYLVDPIFTASLSLAHCAVILWVLPLHLGIGVVTTTLLIAIYPMAIGLTLPVLSALFPLFIAGLVVFAMAIYFKVKVRNYTTQILYLKDQEGIREAQQLKASLYDSGTVPATIVNKSKGYGAILTQVVGKIEESISFLDSNVPLYKQDFQSIINKLYDWVAYFNRRERAKKHALLQPTKITLDKLIRKVELALGQEVAHPPRLLIEKINDSNGAPSPHMVCDINQIAYLLVQAVLRVGKRAGTSIVHIRFHNTALQFKQADAIDNSYPLSMLFQATALVVSQATTLPEVMVKVKPVYDDEIDMMGHQGKQDTPPSIDLQQETISSIVGGHYGHLEIFDGEQQPAMLLVLPSNVTDILSKITINLPLDELTLETPVTPKEQADSMMALMQFHDHVSRSSHRADPIDIGIISGLLLLLRQHFGFKRHASGQLFYVRAVGIAEIVVKWVFHSPKVIYAALLYELVRRTCLPLSYVKEHYNLGVYAFVLNVVGIDKRQALDHPSLLYVQNRLQEAIKEEHVQLSVLFIKLAERLYDLRHAAGYSHLSEVQHMAQETLTIDVELANAYLGPEIGVALEKAAKQALELGKHRRKDQDNEL
ncbi:Sodium:solute symporter family protein [Cardinium endosymbiont of Sogatella furcifera]|uniref:sodium:solute symporter family transporter n=1 Tax=Cardinium endosymbiont of Sogatella furcifera TaxID=650378 RepID=UPI000E0CC090|nr:HD domain-containing protein [Cardinium endosymbiont of Sogatella furcifera]AXI23920.1 Sodium:solute symporter family protein [Cardinium endosymbiont of Sogatella furcifera]